ncbi:MULTISPECIES: DNA adenine methylase [Bacteria][Archaea]|uniref:DNA adenine methylase n=1 Tax=Bacteria TaxID=2 RepID=UPI0025EBC4D8|nr:MULTISPECIES: DNA adenine methylase [Bacteria]
MPTTLSPLRYPGGKTQLNSFVEHTIKMNQLNNAVYCEPFSGGAGVAISLLLNKKAKSIILNDIDIAIYSFWYAIIHESERFIKAVQDITIDMTEWKKQKLVYENAQENNIQEYSFELAFATFFLNRTNRSGIITGGPIGGNNQQSNYKLDCRFKKNSLIRKIRKISEAGNLIRLYHLDAKELISNILIHENTNELFVYFDPPYYKQGKHLYKDFYDDNEHVLLSDAIRKMDDYHWIATYDNAKRIKDIYNDRVIQEYQIQYSANKARKEIELIFHSPLTTIESYGNVKLKS